MGKNKQFLPEEEEFSQKRYIGREKIHLAASLIFLFYNETFDAVIRSCQTQTNSPCMHRKTNRARCKPKIFMTNNLNLRN